MSKIGSLVIAWLRQALANYLPLVIHLPCATPATDNLSSAPFTPSLARTHSALFCFLFSLLI